MSEDLSFRAKWKDEGVDAGLSSTARGMDGVTSRAKLMSESMSGLSGSTRSAASSFSALDSETEKLSDALQDNIIKLRVQRDLLKDPAYAAAHQQAAALKKEVDALTAGFAGSNGAAQKHRFAWAEIVSQYYLASQAIGTLKSGMMSLVDATKEYDTLRARMNAVEGSEALGGKGFETAQRLAKMPGLGLEQVATTMATLRGMKMTAAETESLIVGIGRANASAAGTADSFGRVMTQINQSISVGKLNAQDLKPILQAIPTLAATLEEHYGAITSEALNEKLERSGKSVRDFWLEVAGLGSNLPAASDTIANNLDNLSDAWVRFRASLANSDAIKSATASLTALLDKLSHGMEKVGAEKSLRKRAQVALGFGENLTYYKNTGERNPAILAKMKEIEEWDRSNALMAKAEQEAGEAIARATADANKKKEDARKSGEDAAKSERERIAAHDRASNANVETNFDGSVTMRSGIEWEQGEDPEIAARRGRAEAKRERDEKKALDDQRKALRDNEMEAAKSRLKEAKADEKALEDKKKRFREYSTFVQGMTSNQLKMMMDGDFTAANSSRAAFESIKTFAAEKTASVIGNMIEEAIFGKATAATLAATTSAEMAVIAASAAPAAAGVSLATAGGNSIPASAGMTQTYGLASTLSAVMRARGGQVMGGFIGNEDARSGGEYYTPNTPGRIYNSTQQTTNNVGGAVIHIHAGGGNAQAIAREVAKILPRASNLSSSNRSQTSRSGR